MNAKESVFMVMPGGASFTTTPGTNTPEHLGFGKAHLYAAQQAAATMVPSYVLRDDTGNKRYGFGPSAFLSPTTVLYQIMQLGLRSIWDYSTASWVPLREDQSCTLTLRSKTQEQIG